MPAVWQRMTERVQGALRQADEAVGDGKDDAGGAERNEARAGCSRADADRRSGVVAASAGDRNLAAREAPGARDLGREICRDFRPLDQARHRFFGQAGRREQARVPAPPADIEPQRSRGVRHLRDGFAREAQAHIVLGQQHPPGRPGDLGLMRGDPQHLRRGEARHGEVAGALLEVGDAALELRAFGKRAAVVPQDCGPQRFVMRVEQSCAVHLARESDPRERSEFRRRMAADRGDRRLDALDPVAGILLAPQWMRARDAERRRGFRDHPLIGVDKQRLDRGRADVEPQKRLLLAPTHFAPPIKGPP